MTTAGPDIKIGSRWKANPPGREVVEVRRVWDRPPYGLTVRAHPVHGGSVLVADADWFREAYTEEGADLK